MFSFIYVMAICAILGISLGTLAKNKGYNYWQWFFIGFAFFPFGLIWLLLKKPELKDRDISEYKYKDSEFIRKMKEFDETHK